MHVHLWDPHTPYRVPNSFGDPFKNEPIVDWITKDIFEQHKKHVGLHSIMEIGMYSDDVGGDYLRQIGMCETMEDLKFFKWV